MKIRTLFIKKDEKINTNLKSFQSTYTDKELVSRIYEQILKLSNKMNSLRKRQKIEQILQKRKMYEWPIKTHCSVSSIIKKMKC